MKILYYDCFSGISGDMNLAAMACLGVEPSYLTNELKKLDLDGYSIAFVPDQRKGISGLRADVSITGESGDLAHDHPHTHDHTHPHIHGHDHSNTTDLHTHDFRSFKPAGAITSADEKHSHTAHRSYGDIRQMINQSSLSDNVKELSIKIFHKIAVAEAKIHGKAVDEVHFHEVGAVDSIIDIVGAAICFDVLKPDKVISSPVQLGGGFVECAHGTFPVPAPATLEIVKDIPVKIGAVQVETTTPTGAAIIATLATEFTGSPEFKITKTAYGIGHRDNAIPNVLRVCLAEQDDLSLPEQATATMIECNIDDMNPELYEYVMEKLFLAGADDVYFQPIIMKKTRPATKINVLCKNSLVTAIENILLSETSTLGLRKYTVQKTMLSRELRTIGTKWGQVQIKLGYFNNKMIKSKPEYEDCLRISREFNIPIGDVYKEIALTIQEIK